MSEDDRWVRQIFEDEERAYIEEMQEEFLKQFNKIFGEENETSDIQED